jgi:hypothetical protein
MLERCRQIQLSLNIRKCIFSTPIGILVGHVVYKEGPMVNMEKINMILDIKPPLNKKKIKILLGHTRYYRKFICHYSTITFPIDDLLQNDVEFTWSQDCEESFEFLKNKLVESPILKFRDWSRKFHIHVDASNVAIGSVLAQPYDNTIDH